MSSPVRAPRGVPLAAHQEVESSVSRGPQYVACSTSFVLPLSSVPVGRRTTPPPSGGAQRQLQQRRWPARVAHHERIRRCHHRWAAPEGCPLASITGSPQKKEGNLECRRPVVVVVVGGAWWSVCAWVVVVVRTSVL